MQSSLPLSVSHPLRSMTGLARQISLPGEAQPLRFPSFPALERTAVMGFSQPAVLELPASSEIGVAVCRQAAWPVWADQTLSYTQMVTYRSPPQHSGAFAVSTEWTYSFEDGAIANWTISNRSSTADLVGLAGATNTSPITYPLVGRDGPGPEYVHVPKGANLYALVTCEPAVSGSNVGITLSFEGWFSPGQTTVNTILATGTLSAGVNGALLSLSVPTTFGQWLRPRAVSCSAATASVTPPNTLDVTFIVTTGTVAYTDPSFRGLITVTPADKRWFFPMVQPAEFQNSTLPWYATRVTASALLGTNVSQVLYKGGTVLGGRLSPAIVDMWNASYANVASLHPAEKSFLALETGLYTYCPPSTDLVFFTDYTINTSAGAAATPVYALDNDSLYNRYFIKAGGQPEQLACTASWHIEFRTSSALFQVGLSPITLEALHAAQLMLSELGFFFENENHKGILSKVASFTRKYAPLVGDAVSAVNPAVGKAVKTVAAVITPKVHSQTPKPTTADRSGMNGKRGQNAGKSSDKKNKKNQKK